MARPRLRDRHRRARGRGIASSHERIRGVSKTDAAIDALLAAWDERLRRADENLLALEAEPTYQMLAGPGDLHATLEGTTRTRVEPALGALTELFEHRARLTEVLDRAKAIR